MSVFLVPQTHCFRATVDIGPSSAAIVSSWTKEKQLSLQDYRTNPDIYGIVRLGQFAHLYKKKQIPCTVDWIVFKEDGTTQYNIELKIQHTTDIEITQMATISARVHSIMNTNSFVFKLQNIFQQAHPGELSTSGINGSAGKEGDIQSD